MCCPYTLRVSWGRPSARALVTALRGLWKGLKTASRCQSRVSRGLIFVKWLLVIPHFIALFFVGIAAFFVMIAGFFAVLFTGRWPEGMRTFVIGTMRWSMRATAYAYLVTDVYPPFSLAE